MVGRYIQNKWLYRYVWGCIGLFILSVFAAVFLWAYGLGGQADGRSYDLRAGAMSRASSVEGGALIQEEVRPEEKVAAMFAMPVEPDSFEFLQGINPGFVGLFGTEELVEEELLELLKQVEGYGEPGVFVDFEGGSVNRVRSYLEWENLADDCRDYNKQEMYLLGRQAAERLLDIGIDGVWAPVVDRTNPRSRILRGRTCSENAGEIIELVGAYLEGLEGGGVLSVVKHYPGLGGTDIDPHVASGGVEEVDWEVFEPMIRNADGVMVTHVGVADDKLPCTMSARCLVPLRELEREGEDFLVFSDDMNMAAITDNYSQGEAAYAAVMAGVDVLVYGKGAGETAVDVYWQLVDSYRSDGEFRERVDEAYGKVKRLEGGS